MVVALDGGVGASYCNVLLIVHTHMPCPDTGVKAYAPWVQFVQ